MTFSKRSALFIFIGAVCVLDLLLSVPYKAQAAEAGPDWANGHITVTKQSDLTWTDGDQYTYGNIPCQSLSAYMWGWQSSGWSSWKVKSTQSGCVTAGASTYIGWRQVLPFGSQYWQKLDVLSGYANPWTYANPGTNGLALLTDTYAPYANVPTELYYTDNVLETFSQLSKDGDGNIVRSQSKPFDHRLTYPDGRTFNMQRVSGISYSANGHWMYVDAQTTGQLRINTHDFSVLSFASGYTPSYSLYTAISNSGNTIATHEYGLGLKLYDLTRCDVEKPDYAPRNCVVRDATQNVTDALKTTLADPSKLSSWAAKEIKFVSESQLSIRVSYMYNGEAKYALLSVSTDTTEAPSRYLALGDSFSSGEGAYNYRSVTDFYADENNYNLCHQSLSSYSYLLKKTLSFEWFGSVACSGATQTNVVYSQNPYVAWSAQALGPDMSDIKNINRIVNDSLPGYVLQGYQAYERQPSIATISVGGNDIGFGDIVTACIVNKFFTNMQPCNAGRFDREQVANSIDAEIPKLTATFSSIKQNLSGDQKLYVVGYPKIVNYSNLLCSLNTPMEQSEREFADNLVSYLNEAIRIAANQAGARFIDMSSAFVDSDHDYRLCGNDEQKAVNGLMTAKNSSRKPGSPVASESFHPNKLGHALMAQQIRLLTNDFSLGMPRPVATSSAPSAQFRTQLVGDTVITNPNQSFNYITDSIPNLIVNSGAQVLRIGSEIPGAITQDTTASVELHSTPLTVGQATIKTNNTMEVSVAIPAGVFPGYHQLHILYTDSSGQDYDLYKYVLVVASVDDYDGDGIKNDAEPCVFGNPSGIDDDKDGIDDACDGEYVVIENDSSADTGEVSTNNPNGLIINRSSWELEGEMFKDYVFTSNTKERLSINNSFDNAQTQLFKDSTVQPIWKNDEWLLIVIVISAGAGLCLTYWGFTVVRKSHSR
jgi:lysophospholipase L1-like esterase